jgi:pyruvate dehydrogenase E2 component (dihydrolipoamide acetyltransferase)
MATDVKLPRLGQGMESGVIVRWLKGEGDAIAKGEPLYELDTDKVTQEVEAELDGVLTKIVVPEGEVEVGATIAVVDSPDGESTRSAPAAEPEPAPSDEPSVDQAPPVAAQSSPSSVGAPAGRADTARVKASPLARRIARERGVDLAALSGTGPDGRILAEDVEKAAVGVTAPTAPQPAAPPPAETEVVQLTSVRKTIARRLTEAWAAPVFQLGVSADMAETLALREKLVAGLREGDVKPTVNDVLVKLAAVALTRHTPVNATFVGDEIHRYPAAHVGIAVAAPQGLVVPVIRDADRRTIQEIARARADLVGRSRDNKLKLPDLEGGTFTISNLGMFGVEQFTAVLNPPQVAILAVGSVKDEPVVRDGVVEVAPILRLVLTCDHRAIDGADGAAFLQTLVALVEQPALAL